MFVKCTHVIVFISNSFLFISECYFIVFHTTTGLFTCGQTFSLFPVWAVINVYIQDFFFSFKVIYLFIYFWLRWVFVAARGLSLVVASGGYSSLQCTGFSLWWLLLLRSTGSRHAGFSSCGAWAQLLRGMCDLPGPGLEPVSPALAGRFSTTVPPGKPLYKTFYRHMFSFSWVNTSDFSCYILSVFTYCWI